MFKSGKLHLDNISLVTVWGFAGFMALFLCDVVTEANKPHYDAMKNFIN